MLNYALKFIQNIFVNLYIQINPKYILQCIYNNDIETIKLAVENGFDVNTNMGNGYTLLSISTISLNYEICKYLIANGADVNIVINSGENLIMLLHGYNNNFIYKIYDCDKFVKLFIDSGCNINYINQKNNNMTPLVMAIEYKNYELCNSLIKYGADVNHITSDCYTVLHTVCVTFYNELYYVYYVSENFRKYQLKLANDLYKICVLLVENGVGVLKRNSKNQLCSDLCNNPEYPIGVLKRNSKNQLYSYLGIYPEYPIGDIDTEWLNASHELILKMKTYLEDKIREREMLKTCFKRAQILDDDSYTDEETDDGESEEILEEIYEEL
jgi:ankyrin repeat protein